MAGFGILENGTTFGISLIDLSYEGCRIETSVALLPDLKLRISVLGMPGALAATVRWYRDGRAGLQFKGGQDHENGQIPREHQRAEVSAELLLRRAGRHSYRARVVDVTPRGCKVEYVDRPRPGELLWVKFPGLETVEATVRWVADLHAGLEFVRPIYPAVFDLLVLKLKG